MTSGIEAIPTIAASKRLGLGDVNTVFRCLADNQPPPEKLNFKVIRIPHNSLKLSPPSFEYEDGLYLLLRSDKPDESPVPSALASKVLTDNELASLPNCPWSLSGPQSRTKRTGQQIQQRYCYPRGNSGYSNGKGGAMWTLIDIDGKEDMNRRLLHVYYSNKRDGSDASEKSLGVPSRRPKRKANTDGKVTRKKKSKLAAVGSEMKHASAFHGSVLPSPCFSHLSIDLDGHFDFESDMLGTKRTPTPINRMSATKGTPGNNNFSFIPVQEGHSSYGIENMMLNNPAFNSAVAKSPANFAASKSPSNFQHHYAASHGYYYGQYAYATYPPYPPHGVNAYYRDWLRAAPPIPQAPPSSDQKARFEDEESGLLKVADFTQKLQDLEESLLTDIRKSNSADQVVKLQVLQSWAKGVWSKPLQPQPENAIGVAIEVKSPSPAVGVAKVSTIHHSNTIPQVAMKSPPLALAGADILTSTQSNTNTHVATKVESAMSSLGVADITTATQQNANTEVAIKMKSPGSAVADGCNIRQQSNDNPEVAIKMEAPDEDTSMITPGSIA